MSLRHTLSLVLLIGTASAACTGAPAKGEGVVTITQPTPPAPIIPPLVSGAITASPGPLAIASATVVSLSLSPTGGKEPYQVAWNFGDGTEPGAGPVVSHTFLNTGTFNVVAKVTDAEGKTAEASYAVPVRNLSGRWRVTFGGAAILPEMLDLVQNGVAVTAAINETNDGLGAGTGSVSNPRNLSLSLTFADSLPNPYVVTYVGTVSADLMTYTGTVTGYNVCPCGFTATRSNPPAGLTAAVAP